jgi:alpha-tubulin suppressor-like RCC1 family protein
MQCWGNNQAGQLGLGTSDQSVHGSPTDVPGMTQVAQTSPSCFGTCALTQSQQVYCWGSAVAPSSSPSLVATTGPAAEVSGGDEHACARLVSGAIQCWGTNAQGQLGNGTDAGASPSSPTTVTGL